MPRFSKCSLNQHEPNSLWFPLCTNRRNILESQGGASVTPRWEALNHHKCVFSKQSKEKGGDAKWFNINFSIFLPHFCRCLKFGVYITRSLPIWVTVMEHERNTLRAQNVSDLSPKCLVTCIGTTFHFSRSTFVLNFFWRPYKCLFLVFCWFYETYCEHYLILVSGNNIISSGVSRPIVTTWK